MTGVALPAIGYEDAETGLRKVRISADTTEPGTNNTDIFFDRFFEDRSIDKVIASGGVAGVYV